VAATSGGPAVGRAATTAGQAVGAAASATGQRVGRVAGATGNAVGSAANATGRAATAAASAAGTAAGAVRRLYEPPESAGRDQSARSRFDPTPYVLALMVGLVLFGLIWAVGTLNPEDPPVRATAPATVVEETAPAGEEPAEPAPDAGAEPADVEAGAG
jgi:hypothetical protein